MRRIAPLPRCLREAADAAPHKETGRERPQDDRHAAAERQARSRLPPGQPERDGQEAARELPEEPQQEARRSPGGDLSDRSEEHTSELQSRQYLVCRLLLEK